MVSVGQMNVLGKLEVNQPTATSTGGGKDGYVEVLTCHGRLKKLRGNRSLEDHEAVLNSSYEWVVRYQEAIRENLDKSARWVIKNRIMTVVAYEDDGAFYTFTLNESE